MPPIRHQYSIIITPLLHPPIPPLSGSSFWDLPLFEHTPALPYFHRSLLLWPVVLLGVWCFDYRLDIPFIWVGFKFRGFLRRTLLSNWPNGPLCWFPNQRRQRRLFLFHHLQRFGFFGLDHNYPRIIRLAQSAGECLLSHLEGTRVFLVWLRDSIPGTFASGGDRRRCLGTGYCRCRGDDFPLTNASLALFQCQCSFLVFFCNTKILCSCVICKDVACARGSGFDGWRILDR